MRYWIFLGLPAAALATVVPRRTKDPCEKIAGKPWVKPSKVNACLSYFPFDAKLRDNVVDVVSKTFAQFHASTAFHRNMPSPFEDDTVDLLAELGQIKGTTYKNDDESTERRQTHLLKELVKPPVPRYAAETRELAEDAHKFAYAFSSSPASQSTPHIYISALAFWPKERPISIHYSGNIRSPIEPMRLVTQRGGSIPPTIYGIGSDVKCVAFSQDGSHIVAGSGDTTLRIWEASTGQIVGKPLRGHVDAINSVAYSSNGKHIISGSDDHTVRIWDINETGPTSSRVLMVHSGGVCSVAYSHSGTHIISGSNDRTIRIWDVQADKSVRQLKGHTYGVCSVAYSTDDAYIVSGSSDRTIRIWDAATGQMIGQPLEGHTRDINSVAYSPDSTRIISGSSDRTIRIWDAYTGHMIGKPLEGHIGAINSVACSPDGAQVVSGSSDRTIRIWDLRTGHMVGNYLKGHNGVIRSVAVACDRIVTASADSIVRIWTMDSAQITCRPVKWYTGVVGQTACFIERPLLASQDGDPAI
ncbi:POC1 centriolar protein A, partial [Ceratobasidium sp. 370]